MNLRKFHIDKFPQDRIFILLNEDFHKKLFKYIKDNYNFEELNKIFNYKLNLNNYKRWCYRTKKPRHEIPQFIPLWFIVKISKLVQKFPLILIEKNIIAYQGPSVSSIIWNLNLPLIEDERLLKIVAHLIGDGHAGGGFGTKLPKGKTHSEYKNFAPELLDQFEKDLNVFGEVHTTKNYKNGSLIIPNSIGYILREVYKINFDTFNSKVPSILFNLNKRVIAAFIRAFGDDEAHVYDNHIEFYSGNKTLIMGIMFLLNKRFPEIKFSKLKVNITPMKNPKYYFYILSESREDYYNLIGFDSKEKTESLLFNIKRGSNIYNKNKKGGTKKLILNYLKLDNLTGKQLSRKIGISHGTVLDHLNQLKENNKIIIKEKEKFSNIWSLK